MPQRTRGLVLIALAGTSLGVLWRLMPAASPPIYDGICVADPYRAMGSSPPPSSASMTYPAGDTPVSDVRTAENPAQAEVLMMSGALSSPASQIVVSIAAVPAPGPRPAHGSIDGNVYRFSATTASAAALTPSSPVTVLLRGTRSTPAHTLERLDGARWTPLQTFLEGCGDVFEADSNRLGDFALVVSGAPAPGPGGAAPVGLIAGALTVALIATILLLVRLGRTRSR
jgi:hypothetical protein